MFVYFWCTCKWLCLVTMMYVLSATGYCFLSAKNKRPDPCRSRAVLHHSLESLTLVFFFVKLSPPTRKPRVIAAIFNALVLRVVTRYSLYLTIRTSVIRYLNFFFGIKYVLHAWKIMSKRKGHGPFVGWTLFVSYIYIIKYIWVKPILYIFKL